MSPDALELGRVVLSRAGRDKGRYFVVIARIDEQHVALCDGETHKAEDPKKKKEKHVTPRPETVGTLAAKTAQGVRVENHEVRAALDALGYSRSKRRERGKGMRP